MYIRSYSYVVSWFWALAGHSGPVSSPSVAALAPGHSSHCSESFAVGDNFVKCLFQTICTSPNQRLHLLGVRNCVCVCLFVCLCLCMCVFSITNS